MNPCSLVIPGKTGWRAWQWWESMLGKLPGWEYTYIHTYIYKDIYLFSNLIWIRVPFSLVQRWSKSNDFSGQCFWCGMIALLFCWHCALLVHCGHCFYLLCVAAPLSEEGCIVIIASTCCVLLLLWAKKGALWTLLFLFVVSCSSSEQRSLEPEATKLEPNWYN
jgi:hypothetical protein